MNTISLIKKNDSLYFLSKKQNIIKQLSSLANHYEGVVPKSTFQPIKGDGAYLIGVDNKKILCANSAYGAARFGFTPQSVINALRDQSSKLTLSSRAFHYPLLDTYSNAITNQYQNVLLGPKNQQLNVVFKEGGAAAVDAAIKIAKAYGHMHKNIEDGKQKIIFAGGETLFHGRSEAVLPPALPLDLSPMTHGFGQTNHPNKILIDFNNKKALKNACEDPNVCAVIIELIAGEGGVLIPDQEYLSNLQTLCQKHNILIILDEVQTTYSTGYTSASQHPYFSKQSNIKGDMIISAKAISSGVTPSSYVISTKKIMDVLKPGSEGSTFGANQVACAVGLATIDMIKNENLLTKIQNIGKEIKANLQSIEKEYPTLVKETRGLGCMLGLELQSNHVASHVKKSLLNFKQGDNDGIHVKIAREDTLRISPNTEWKNNEINYFQDGLRNALKTYKGIKT